MAMATVVVAPATLMEVAAAAVTEGSEAYAAPRRRARGRQRRRQRIES